MTQYRKSQTPSSNSGARLDALAAKAKMQYGASIAYWMATARTLREARAICPHGQWQAFLAKAGIPERTGRNMLRLADFKTETVAVLGGIKATLADIEQARHFEERAAALATASENAAAWHKSFQEMLAMWEAATPEQREWIDRECRDFRAWREAYTPGDSELDTFIATIWKLLELE